MVGKQRLGLGRNLQHFLPDEVLFVLELAQPVQVSDEHFDIFGREGDGPLVRRDRFLKQVATRALGHNPSLARLDARTVGLC